MTLPSEGTFTGTHDGVRHGPTGDVATTLSVDYVGVLQFRHWPGVSFALMFDSARDA